MKKYLKKKNYPVKHNIDSFIRGICWEIYELYDIFFSKLSYSKLESKQALHFQPFPFFELPILNEMSETAPILSTYCLINYFSRF